jgi:5-methylcytosine-specific restriction endonuclease McrA
VSGPLFWMLDPPEIDDRSVPKAAKRQIREYLDSLVSDPCSYCGAASEVRDHIRPRAQGGRDSWANLTGACHACNSAKRDRHLLGFLGKRRWIADARAQIAAIQAEVRAWDRLGRSA